MKNHNWKISERFDDLGADGTAVRLGIFGGTFDPVHVGHLRIAEEVREALDLDAVLFVPAGIPVYKKDCGIADPAVRFHHVRKAVQGNPHFDASPIEIERPGDTFTIETMQILRAHYPDNVEFFFIIGDDAARSLHKWRSSEQLAKLTSFAIATGRPNGPDKNELREQLQAVADFDLHFVPVSALEVSSHDIRERVHDGRSIRYLVPQNVYDAELQARARHEREAWREKLELDQDGGQSQDQGQGQDGGPGQDDDIKPDSEAATNPKIESNNKTDALTPEFLAARQAELQQRVSPKRYAHSLAVSQTAAELAEMYDVPVDRARLAGMLHDWDKGMDDEGIRYRVHELGMHEEIDPFVVEHMPATLHGITAARALGNEFPQIPEDVLQAIERHTVANLHMEPLDMVLYIADAIEPSRQFGRIDELREAVGKVSLEELFFQTYEYWTFLLFERRKPLHPDTITIWNAYTEHLKRNKEGKRKKGKK